MTCPESDEEPSFLQILYHSITTKVVAINIQVSEAAPKFGTTAKKYPQACR